MPWRGWISLRVVRPHHNGSLRYTAGGRIFDADHFVIHSIVPGMSPASVPLGFHGLTSDKHRGHRLILRTGQNAVVRARADSRRRLHRKPSTLYASSSINCSPRFNTNRSLSMTVLERNRRHSKNRNPFRSSTSIRSQKNQTDGRL